MFCTYMTRHPSGHFYIGKSSLARIDKGYTGSGRRLNCAYLQPGFEPHTWTTTVLSMFEDEVDAYLDEARRVPLSLLCDPYCLNETPGGKGSFRGSAYALILKKQKKPAKKKEKRLIRISDVIPKNLTQETRK